MTAFKLDHFGGMQPVIDDRLLPEHAAAYSRDAFLYSGALVGWRMPKDLFTLVGGTTRKAFRIPVDLAQDQITDASYWLEFADADTDVIRTPVVDDTFQRYYFASPSVRPKYNTVARIASSLPPWFLGVPRPTNPPGVVPSGGGAGLAQARSYTYTYVTEYGEEGPNATVLVVNGYTDDAWTVTVTPPVANDQGVDRNITHTRIYRTVTSTAGVASYFLVTEITAGTTTYVDTLDDSVIAQNNQLESFNWIGPPSDLQGFIQAPNGMIVGFRENEIWFCQPFRPHAWPSVYTLTTEFPIVGLGVAGQSVVAVTKGYPAIVQGVDPNSVTVTAIRQPQPCSSRGAIVSTPTGVFYPSPNGLVQVSSYGQATLLTQSWFNKETWNEQVPGINHLRATQVGAAYVAFGTVYVDPDTNLDVATYAAQGFSLDVTRQDPTFANSSQYQPVTAFGQLTAPDSLSIYNVMTDFWTATSLIIQDGKIKYYDFTDAAPTLMPYKWKSKVMQGNAKRNYEVVRLWFSVPANTPAQNVDRVLDAISLATLNDDQYGIVRVYAGDTDDAGDMTLFTSREIRKSGELLRILSGAKYEFWQFEIEARVRISNLQAAHAVKELAQV